MNDDISLGELSRALKALTDAVSEVSRKIDSRPTWEELNRVISHYDERGKIIREQLAQKNSEQDTAIKDLEEQNVWMFRAVIGSVLTALAGFFISINGVLGGG